MIKCNKGMLKVKGSFLQVLSEYAVIHAKMVELYGPEVVEHAMFTIMKHKVDEMMKDGKDNEKAD